MAIENKILTKEELQKDVGDLLDYLHLTKEYSWDLQFIRQKIMENMKRFDENIVYYNTPINTNDFVKLIYSRADVRDLIGTMTDKYVAIGKLKLKDEYKNQ